MIRQNTLKKFKKLNSGDVMGVVRTLYPNIEIETILSEKKRKSS